METGAASVSEHSAETGAESTPNVPPVLVETLGGLSTNELVEMGEVDVQAAEVRKTFLRKFGTHIPRQVQPDGS